jgi:hypothetical protein
MAPRAAREARCGIITWGKGREAPHYTPIWPSQITSWLVRTLVELRCAATTTLHIEHVSNAFECSMAHMSRVKTWSTLINARETVGLAHGFYPPILFDDSICPFYLPILFTNSTYTLYQPIVFANSICQLYLPNSICTLILSADSICRFYLPILSTHSICTVYLHILSTNSICTSMRLAPASAPAPTSALAPALEPQLQLQPSPSPSIWLCL